MSRLAKTMQHPLIGGYLPLPIYKETDFAVMTYMLAALFWICVIFGGDGSLSGETTGFISSSMAFNLFMFILMTNIFKWVVLGSRGYYKHVR